MSGPAGVAVPSAFLRSSEADPAWLAALPATAARWMTSWGCAQDGTVTHGRVGLVVPVHRGAERLVLKVSPPHPGNAHEGAALRVFAGRGAVRLLCASDDGFALLLERGGSVTLDAVRSSAEAIETSGQLARVLAVAAPAHMPRLADTVPGWLEEIERQSAAVGGAVPRDIVDRALSIVRTLDADEGATMLHGDLHSANVLAAERTAWLAIDPKGLAGTAPYDAFTAALDRREGFASADPRGVLRRRVTRFCRAAGVDTALGLDLAQARAVSSLLWERLHGGEVVAVDLLERLTGVRD